jgi:aldehyde:ferredoxin oxidoreductase
LTLILIIEELLINSLFMLWGMLLALAMTVILPLDVLGRLIFATGPLSGTMGPTAGNGYAVVSKSPATGGVGEAKAHGFFGPDLKRAGYDAVIFYGKSDRPVYLWIDDDAVQLLDAKYLWGKSPQETEDAIRKELKDAYIRVASIGVAGERCGRDFLPVEFDFSALELSVIHFAQALDGATLGVIFTVVHDLGVNVLIFNRRILNNLLVQDRDRHS